MIPVLFSFFFLSLYDNVSRANKIENLQLKRNKNRRNSIELTTQKKSIQMQTHIETKRQRDGETKNSISNYWNSCFSLSAIFPWLEIDFFTRWHSATKITFFRIFFFLRLFFVAPIQKNKRNGNKKTKQQLNCAALNWERSKRRIQMKNKCKRSGVCCVRWPSSTIQLPTRVVRGVHLSHKLAQLVQVPKTNMPLRHCHQFIYSFLLMDTRNANVICKMPMQYYSRR